MRNADERTFEMTSSPGWEEVGRRGRVGLIMTALFCSTVAAAGSAGTIRRLAVREIQPSLAAPTPYLSRPVSIVCDAESVYVLDSADADIKVFSRDGAFRRTIGRKGQGPGEFRLPNDLDVFAGRVYVADSANRRLQILDADGKPLGGFGLGMTPWRILVLDEDRILVAGLPSGRPNSEKLISCYRRDGATVWQAVEPLQSGDSVHDALRNQLFLKRSPDGGFRLVRSFNDRMIRTMNADGFLTGEAAASEAALPFKEITVPTANGQKKKLKGFCWSCAGDGGRLYVLSPEYTADHDLGPGRMMAVFNDSLEVEATIELPEKMTKFAVAGNTIYGIDTDSCLRMFVIGPTPAGDVRIVGSLEEAVGRSPGPAVLVFFSLDCPICWEELFEVRYIVEKNCFPVALAGISADSRDDLEPFLAKHAFFDPVVSDPGRELFRKYKVKLEPFVMAVDGSRIIYQDSTADPMDLRREKLKLCLLEISAKRPS